jgi:hypothetical protein
VQKKELESHEEGLTSNGKLATSASTSEAEAKNLGHECSCPHHHHEQQINGDEGFRQSIRVDRFFLAQNT